jgi:hypothetical protein
MSRTARLLGIAATILSTPTSDCQPGTKLARGF